MMVLSPEGAITALSVGIIGGWVFQGLNTIGGTAEGFEGVLAPGKVTIFDAEPNPMG